MLDEKLVGLLISLVVVVVVVVVVELLALVETVVSRFGSEVVRPLSLLLLFVVFVGFMPSSFFYKQINC